jgi:hypothetical protein
MAVEDHDVGCLDRISAFQRTLEGILAPDISG